MDITTIERITTVPENVRAMQKLVDHRPRTIAMDPVIRRLLVEEARHSADLDRDQTIVLDQEPDSQGRL